MRLRGSVCAMSVDQETWKSRTSGLKAHISCIAGGTAKQAGHRRLWMELDARPPGLKALNLYIEAFSRV
jgi:hypothetical protein